MLGVVASVEPRRRVRLAISCWLSFWLLATLAGCAARNGAAGPIPDLAEFAGREVREVEFTGTNLVVPVDSLEAITAIEPTQCRVPFLPRGACFIFGYNRQYLEMSELARDLLRIQLFYRDQGYYGTRVEPSVDPLSDNNVVVRFAVTPGDEVILRQLDVEGTEEIVPPEEIEAALPLELGGPFRRVGFLSSADTIRTILQRHGYPYADVLRNYAIDTIADVAEAQFIALPGPLVTIDSVLVLGNDRLDRATILQQLTFRAGNVLRVPELNSSQRNLYALGMVNFASVEIAPDTLQVNADTALGTVAVRIIEAPQYLVDASAGYGTIDCLRTGAGWTNRNVLGGARRLQVTGSVSKIGVGDPADWGFQDNFLCGALAQDTLSQELNYTLAADVQQPRLFGTRNELSVGVFAERQSELNTYLRQAVGGQVSLTRPVGGTLLTTTFDVQRGSTKANAEVFCVGFDLCSPSDVNRLQNTRWSNALSLGALWDRTGGAAYTSRGFQLRGAAVWSDPALGSEDQYLRLLGEGAAYREVRPGWVVAGRVQAGGFVDGTLVPATGFIPPQQRFYAGGPSTVRGFERNGLGPQAYLLETVEEDGDTLTSSSATGGTQLALGSVELRTPSPFFSEYLRFGAFVDVGQVWAPGTRATAEMIRATPGVGVRFVTPVGPIRVDLAYNPYQPRAGPLYRVREDGTLELIRGDFVPRDEADSFWSRLQLQFAVGQAF